MFVQAQTGRKNAVYLEVLGSGGWFSLNYERKIWAYKKLSLQLRGGAGTYRLKDYKGQWNPDLVLPFSAIARYGHRHQAELGLGQTLSSLPQYDAQQQAPKRSLSLSTHAMAGYRYIASSGLLLGISYTPILEFQRSIRHWLGVSIGYAF